LPPRADSTPLADGWAPQNWELPEVREAIYENAVRYWLDKGLDGFRCVLVSTNQPWRRKGVS
jgi:glycosidase